MAAILLNDTDILRLAAQVNTQRAAGLIPTGGLLVSRGTYFQMMVTGTSAVTYTVVMEASDKDFQDKANILSGLGAFALGTPQQINGYWVQAFGDMAGSSGGGGSGLPDGTTVDQTIQWDGSAWQPGVIPANALIYGVDDALGADLPTIIANADAGFVQGLVVIDASGQENIGFFFADSGVPAMQLTTDGIGVSLQGPSGAGNLSLQPGDSSLLTGDAQSGFLANPAGITVKYKGENMVTATGTDASSSVLLIHRAFGAANTSELRIANTQVVLRLDTSNNVSVNNGTTTVTGNGKTYTFGNSLQPPSGATSDLGTSGTRWRSCYLVNAPDVSSDARVKTTPEPIPDAVLDAVGDINLVQYKLLSEIDQVGDDAKINVGMIAQQAIAAFSAHGIDALEYGFVIYSEWPAVEEVLDDQGNVIVEAQPGGNMYSVRYDQLLTLEAARIRRELARLSSN